MQILGFPVKIKFQEIFNILYFREEVFSKNLWEKMSGYVFETIYIPAAAQADNSGSVCVSLDHKHNPRETLLIKMLFVLVIAFTVKLAAKLVTCGVSDSGYKYDIE